MRSTFIIMALMLWPAVVRTGFVPFQPPEPMLFSDPLTMVICDFETQAEPDPDDAVSFAGALGRCQVKSGTAKQVGFTGPNRDLLSKAHISVMVADTIVRRCGDRYRRQIRWPRSYRAAYCYYAGFKAEFNQDRRGRDYARNIALKVALEHLRRGAWKN